jgi:hypothetical protein
LIRKGERAYRSAKLRLYIRASSDVSAFHSQVVPYSIRYESVDAKSSQYCGSLLNRSD